MVFSVQSSEYFLSSKSQSAVFKDFFVFAGKPFCKGGVISSNYNLKLNKYE